MRNLDTLVRFDLRGFREVRRDDAVILWVSTTDPYTRITLNSFHLPPDIPVVRTLRDLRAFMRSQALMIETDVEEVGGLATLTTLIKVPQTPHGMTYLASLIVPFRTWSFVVKVECLEGGVTGIREAVVFGKDHLPEHPTGDPLSGWILDAYDPGAPGEARNRAEDPRYDAKFPRHPLSRARALQNRIRKTLWVHPCLLTEPPWPLPKPMPVPSPSRPPPPPPVPPGDAPRGEPSHRA
jgi:hypothetical protein